MIKVAVTGGIGSGKSTLTQMFGELGAPVYNSDLEAKALMSSDHELKAAIIDCFGSDSYVAGELNRPYLAQRVFSDPQRLSQLNSLVHPRVKLDFEEWCSRQDAPYVILECAILFEAKFDSCVDHSICVLSPMPMRIKRVMSRDGLTKEQVEARMANQLSDDEIHTLADLSVVNFDIEDLEDAAKLFDRKFRHEATQN